MPRMDNVPEDYRGVLTERIVDFSIVERNNNMRVVDASRYFEDELKFFVFDSAIPMGFEGGSWVEKDELIVNGENILKADAGTVRMISCTPPSTVDSLYTDDGETYISSYSKNVFTIVCELDKIKPEALGIILDGFDIKPVPPEERIWRQIKKILSKSYNAERESLERDIKSQESMMKQAYQNYQRALTIKTTAETKLNGVGKDEDYEKLLLERFERLYKSPYIDGVEIEENKFIVITKPLTIGLWNIGKYSIAYTVGREEPVIKRLTPPVGQHKVIHLSNSNYLFADMHAAHPHISNGMCMGNAREILTTFWDGDYLTAFNFMVQYLRSYHSANPYIQFESYLASIGYINDAKILYDNGKIHSIHDGIFKYSNGREITVEKIREWGCTGVVQTQEEIEEMINSRDTNNGVSEDSRGILYSPPETLVPSSGREGGRGDYECEWCSDGIERGEHYTVQDEIICGSCYDNVRSCAGCGEERHSDNMYTFEDEYYCESCYNDVTDSCGRCGVVFRSGQLTHDEVDDERYCDSCMEIILERRRSAGEESTTEPEPPTPISPTVRIVGGRTEVISGGARRVSLEELSAESISDGEATMAEAEE